MDFSLTTLFVVPSTNTLPTSGSTNNLTPGQVGFFNESYAARTSGNISGAKYIYVAQGRTEDAPLGSKRSDRIYASKVIDFYKVTAENTAQVQISEVSALSFKCDEDITVSIRLFSNYINSGFYNGLTRSVTVKTPCCDCGDDPCTDVDPETVVTELVAKINAEPMLSKFLVAEKIGTSTNTKIRLVGKPLTVYGQPCDITAFPFEYDRMYFHTYIHKGPDTTQDYIVADRCDIPGTITVTQRSTYPQGSSDAIKLMERRYYAYQTMHKHLFSDPKFNGAYQSYVVDGTFYDTYVVRFNTDEELTWAPKVPMDATVIFAVPTGTSAATNLAAILTAFLGTPKDMSIADVTTTTTTSTTTTSTTTTTTLTP